jgi:uncharacterized protein YndB with AHSA1/START domain
MTEPSHEQPDAMRDLVLERIVDVPPGDVWAAWTTPSLVTQWFTPAPWTTVACEMDLRPGGRFRTVMRSPEGQDFDIVGCILEVVPPRRLVWTGALLPDYRPHSRDAESRIPFLFTAVISLEPSEGGTKYTALAIHADEAGRDAHAAMGFHAGWGAALDQLVALMKRQRAEPASNRRA